MKEDKDKKRLKKLRKKVQIITGLSNIELNNMLKLDKISLQLQRPNLNYIQNPTHLAFIKYGLIRYVKIGSEKIVITKKEYDIIREWSLIELDTEEETKPIKGYTDSSMYLAFEAGIDSVKSGIDFYQWMKNYTKNK